MASVPKRVGELLPAIPQQRQSAASHHSLDDVLRMAEEVAKGQLFPGIRSTQAAFTLMMTCQAEGLHPMMAMKRYHIIQGRISMRADAMLAEYKARGGKVKWIRSDEEACEAHWWHPSLDPEGITIKLTLKRFVDKGVAMCWDDKKRCMVLKDNWKNYPDSMLRARNTSMGVRVIDPGAIAGTYTPEEIVDFNPGDLEAFEADAVAEDSRPAVEATVVDATPRQERPILPAIPPKVDNNSGHATGQYASPEQVDHYKAATREFCATKNAQWADEWTDERGELKEGVKDVINGHQMTNHLLKWALRTRRLAPVGMTWDPETGKPAVKASSEQAIKYVAIVFAREPEAVAEEAELYYREQADLAREDWRKKHAADEEDIYASEGGGAN